MMFDFFVPDCVVTCVGALYSGVCCFSAFSRLQVPPYAFEED